MSERLIVFDGKMCIGCHSCEISCQLENDVPPGVRMRWVKSHVEGSFPQAYEWSISTSCFHCEDPSCVSSCPAGALYRRKDGVVVHLRNRCVGCGYCIQNCPFHVPKISPSQHTMRKCSFCIQRTDKGKEPACVAKCPTHALTYVKDANTISGVQAYGKQENLHMVYILQGMPKDYNLPVPVPLNTVTSLQGWKWLAGFAPLGFLVAWLWGLGPKEEKDE